VRAGTTGGEDTNKGSEDMNGGEVVNKGDKVMKGGEVTNEGGEDTNRLCHGYR